MCETRCAVGYCFNNEMNYSLGASLDSGINADKASTHHHASEAFHQTWPNYKVCDAGFILNRHEDNTFRTTGLLTDQDNTGGLNPSTVGETSHSDARRDGFSGK
jgi:hypothetical protein